MARYANVDDVVPAAEVVAEILAREPFEFRDLRAEWQAVLAARATEADGVWRDLAGWWPSYARWFILHVIVERMAHQRSRTGPWPPSITIGIMLDHPAAFLDPALATVSVRGIDRDICPGLALHRFIYFYATANLVTDFLSRVQERRRPRPDETAVWDMAADEIEAGAANSVAAYAEIIAGLGELGCLHDLMPPYGELRSPAVDQVWARIFAGVDPSPEEILRELGEQNRRH